MSLENILDQPLNPWMNGGGPDGDIVLSSRVRLARNLIDVPFPNRADAGQLATILGELRKSVNDLTIKDREHRYLFIEMDKLSPLERYVLVEKHIISPNLAQEADQRGLIVRDDAAISIMINEEDHLRVQCLLPGLNLSKALKEANEIDDVIESRHDIAFNEQMGYLTACPTNLGTGLRASVMIHLPALVLTHQISRLVNAATQLGLAVRGIYGEGSEAVGNIFQISNQLTLGHSEEEIVENLQSVAKQVVDHERTARQALLSDSKDILADRVWRSYGVLAYARTMSGQEALSMMSEVRLGIDLKLIEEVPANVFNELLVTTRPNFLQKIAGQQELSPVERDKFRAQIIRQRLEETKVRGGK